MGRSGYDDCCDGWDLIRWRGAVASAIRGRRGQAFLREMLAAMDALPHPVLVAHDLIAETGEVCAIGSVGLQRGIDLDAIDAHDRAQVARVFGIAEALAAEIAFVNDEYFWGRTEAPEHRFKRVRAWIVSQLAEREEPTP